MLTRIRYPFGLLRPGRVFSSTGEVERGPIRNGSCVGDGLDPEVGK